MIFCFFTSITLISLNKFQKNGYLILISWAYLIEKSLLISKRLHERISLIFYILPYQKCFYFMQLNIKNCARYQGWFEHMLSWKLGSSQAKLNFWEACVYRLKVGSF